jgi:nitronate monooxygenase
MKNRISAGLSLPVIGAPLFIVSGPELVIAQCRAGIVGSFPSLNARPQEELDRWIATIQDALSATAADNEGRRCAPFAVNLIASRVSNARLEHDLAVCVRRRVPIIITSMGAPAEIAEAVHSYGGIVLHDVISSRHAEKALRDGADGLVLVAAGAGGHGGTLNPIAFTHEVRGFHDGPLILSGGITTGKGVFAARAMGADLAYIGTRFVATEEANALPAYKQMIVESRAEDITYTSQFSGVKANYLKGSIVAAGLDPDRLAGSDHEGRYVAGAARAKAWSSIWGAGHGVGSINDVLSTGALVLRMKAEYLAAQRQALDDDFL